MPTLSRREAITRGGAALAGATLAGATSAVAQPTTTMFKRLEGKVAFVTGAARGIGRATAVRLAQEGADIALLDIADPDAFASADGYRLASREDLSAAAEAVREEGRRAIEIVADVRDLAAMREAAKRTADELGSLNIAVANAGLVVWSTIEESTEVGWRDVVDVNVNGVFNTIQAALPLLKQSEAGRIVALSSIGGRQGVVGNGSYAATKWAVIGLVKSAALEFGKYGITVNAVAPTAVNTPMYRSEGQEASTGVDSPEAQNEQMLGYHPLEVPAVEPEDIAAAIAYLASEDARYVSGLVMDVAAGGNARYTA